MRAMVGDEYCGQITESLETMHLEQIVGMVFNHQKLYHHIAPMYTMISLTEARSAGILDRGSLVSPVDPIGQTLRVVHQLSPARELLLHQLAPWLRP